MNLKRDSLRPGASELRGREGSGEQQRSLRAGARLRQHLSRHRPEREPGVDELVRQAVGGEATALADRPEANLRRVPDTLVEVDERLTVVEIRGMNDVPGSAELVGESEEPRRLPLRVVEKKYLSHVAAR